MENLGKLIRKFATQEVLDGISRRMKNAGDEEACLWIADPTNEKYYRNWKESEKSQELYEKEKMGYGWHVNSVGMMGGNFTNDSFEDPLKDIRLKFKYVWEFKEFLEIYQNYVDEFSDFEIIHSSDHPYVQSVIDLLKKDYPEWILKEGVGICNRWEASLGKRIQEKN